MRVKAAVTLGILSLLVWAAAQYVAFDMAGGGHGWIAPFYYSILLPLLYPLAVARAVLAGRGSILVDLCLLGVAAALDLLLVANILFQENDYFVRLAKIAPEFLLLWIGLWAGWQALAILALSRNSRANSAAGG